MPTRSTLLLAAVALSCARSVAPVEAPVPDAPRWPASGAPLTAPAVPASSEAGRRWRIYVDAGHGARNNGGTHSVTCEAEESFTLRVANDLATRLPALGPFDVRVSRDGSRPVAYEDRVAAAEAWRADAFVGIHMDARGAARAWEAAPGRVCWRQDESPGFALLWSSEGDAAAIARRRLLARSIAARMTESGFLPYDGVDYPGHYVDDPDHRAVFENRAGVGRRIFLLRKPAMPAVIVETHHSLDVEESARWNEDRTLEVFAAAIAAGLVDALDVP